MISLFYENCQQFQHCIHTLVVRCARRSMTTIIQ